MVTIDKKNKLAFLSPHKQNKKSYTLVVTIPKYFAEMLEIEAGTPLRFSLHGKQLILSKV